MSLKDKKMIGTLWVCDECGKETENYQGRCCAMDATWGFCQKDLCYDCQHIVSLDYAGKTYRIVLCVNNAKKKRKKILDFLHGQGFRT